MAGTVYSNKAEAIAAFKSKAKADPQLQQELAREYPTTFNTQPATRPAYIPERYNGSPVVFNNGGYGYYNGGIWTPLVTYMLLDTLGDVAMMNAMGGHGYPIENYAPPGMAPVAAPMAARHHSVLFYLFWLAVGAFAVIMIGKLLARRMN